MLKESRNLFESYLVESGASESRASVLRGVYKKLIKWEESLNKNLTDMTKEEMISLCVNNQNEEDESLDSLGRKRKGVSSSIANRSYGSMQTRVEAINEILNWLQIDIKLSMKDFDIKKALKSSEKRYFTMEEIQDICDVFLNPQDRYIIYGIFSGIYGKAYSDLLELKVEDVDMVNRVITTKSGKTIMMDDYLYTVIQHTLDPVLGGHYLKHFGDGNEGTTTEGYDLRTNSEYVLRPKPYSKNNDGYDAMKLNGVQTRLKKLSEAVEINLSGIDILRSGIMHQMNLIEQNKGVAWTCASVEAWLKENEISAQPFELYRLYKMKYGKETTGENL